MPSLSCIAWVAPSCLLYRWGWEQRKLPCLSKVASRQGGQERVVSHHHTYHLLLFPSPFLTERPVPGCCQPQWKGRSREGWACAQAFQRPLPPHSLCLLHSRAVTSSTVLLSSYPGEAENWELMGCFSMGLCSRATNSGLGPETQVCSIKCCWLQTLQ